MIPEPPHANPLSGVLLPLYRLGLLRGHKWRVRYYRHLIQHCTKKIEVVQEELRQDLLEHLRPFASIYNLSYQGRTLTEGDLERLDLNQLSVLHKDSLAQYQQDLRL